MTEMTDDEIAQLLDPASDLDRVFELLGASIPGRDGFGGDLIERGRTTFANVRGKVRTVLCPKLQDDARLLGLVASQQSGDLIAGVAAIASILGSSIAGISMNGTIVAVIVVRMGVRSLCIDLPQ